MEPLKDSLDAQHLQLFRELEAVIAAGRAGRWPEYRQRFGALHEGLAQHMAFGNETRREAQERLRQHLEMLGAAAPEHDPEGCLAALEELAGLMQQHHAAEMALDPQYASRPVPRLALGAPAPMDLRGLQPPEPMVRIFQALAQAPGAPLRVILPHEPVPLYALLRERGFTWSGAERADGSYELAIRRA